MKRDKKRKATEPPREPRIISAVGVCAVAINPSDTGLAKQVEQAMSEAVLACIAEGISINDSPTIKARMLAARKRVLNAAGVPE